MGKAQYLHPSIMDKQLWPNKAVALVSITAWMFSFSHHARHYCRKQNTVFESILQTDLPLCPYCRRANHANMMTVDSFKWFGGFYHITHTCKAQLEPFKCIKWQGVRGWMTAMCFQVIKKIGLSISQALPFHQPKMSAKHFDILFRTTDAQVQNLTFCITHT